ncbi:uncharacterized protein I303_100938 [Kwoniella dejecticola CBS 10117]|uniref:Phenazine biosynthesis protein n=1 Tax=Kwoniella dejecticola CBS 10117 TaxID=1296121 RepID=A0A1A6AGB4_9TREE|nr:uncharacterized protein I303_00942 [Kwoniella dejecticola CBS 10117]OBR89120.1 hypothetical protein I303_00942 [Kwoniella dejecticola CBS 10117]
MSTSTSAPSTPPLPFHLVNAFIVESNPHSGNQAAVVIFPDATDPRANNDEWLKAVTRDFNFSETAFLVPLSPLPVTSSSAGEDDAEEGEWGLRWFVPECEVPLCGHATLASSEALFSLHPSLGTIKFQTRFSGQLIATRLNDNQIQISLPTLEDDVLSQKDVITTNHHREIESLRRAFGIQDVEGSILGLFEMHYSGIRCLIIQLSEGVDVEDIKVDFRALAEVTGCAVITQVNTAESIRTKQLHVNSRVFDPALGIDEDAVTGSSHANLTGYYFRSIGSRFIPPELSESVESITELTLVGHQRSSRGGELICNLDEDNHAYVKIVGNAHKFGNGTLYT